MGAFVDSVLDAAKAGYESIGKMAGRGSSAISSASRASSTILNGPNSLARNLFESSNNTEAWYKMVMNKGGKDEWRLSGAKVAAAGVGLSAAGRLATGGGIYRDADGNTDIIGIPFI